MNEYLVNNIKVIKEKRKEITLNKEIIERMSEQEDVTELETYNGFSLRSMGDHNLAIKVWCEQFKELKYNSIVVVFGIGTLDYFVEFCKLYPELDLVVYEPCEEIFYNCLACGDYTELLNNGNVVFCVGKSQYGTFVSLLHGTMGYESVSKPYYALIPNYNKIFSEEFELYEETIINSFKTNWLSRYTEHVFEDDRLDNYLDNLTVLPYESTVIELRNSFNKFINITEYPAIVLSAGPSLDKNINSIKKIKGRAFIICVDAALNTAIKNGVRPDMVVNVDPVIGADSLRDDEGRDIPLLIHMSGSIPIRNICRGRKFYITDIDYYLVDVLKECDKSMSALSTGGSVANTAFSLARELGFKTIVLMGQDLGYPDNKLHAEDAFIDEEDADENDDSYFSVDSIDGGKVLTSTDMDEYRKWFEKNIRLYPDVKVVDATEGGALIKGTEISSIEEAIDKYCPKETLCFEDIVNASDYLLNDEERVIIKEVIAKTFDDIDDNIEYLKKAKRDYQKLGEVNKKRKYNTKEFKRLVEAVGEYNKYLDENKDFYIYKKCCTDEYYRCTDALKEVYDDEYDNIKNIVDISLIMLDEFIQAGTKLKEKWNKINNGDK